MKTYNELLQKINESEYGFGGGFGNGDPSDSYGRSAHSDAGIYRTESPAQLKRLNAFVNAFTQKEFLDPRAALGMLRAKLNIAGLDFKIDMAENLEDGSTSYRLYKFGGTFGKSPTTPHNEFEVTDGFEEGKSYALNINMIDVPNGLYKVDAKIVETTSFDVENDEKKDSKELHPGKSEKKEKDTLESFTSYEK
jgi:hypothetical protein